MDALGSDRQSRGRNGEGFSKKATLELEQEESMRCRNREECSFLENGMVQLQEA